jgi:hypothetical protein
MKIEQKTKESVLKNIYYEINGLRGDLVDFAIHYGNKDNVGAYRAVRNLSNRFRDLSKKGCFQYHLKFKRISFLKKDSALEHCLSCQNVAYKFALMHYSDVDGVTTDVVFDFLEKCIFQIYIPLSYWNKEINKIKINGALAKVQNKVKGVFVSFDEYNEVLEMYELFLTSEDKRILMLLFDNANK